MSSNDVLVREIADWLPSHNFRPFCEPSIAVPWDDYTWTSLFSAFFCLNRWSKPRAVLSTIWWHRAGTFSAAKTLPSSARKGTVRPISPFCITTVNLQGIVAIIKQNKLGILQLVLTIHTKTLCRWITPLSCMVLRKESHFFPQFPIT